MTSSFARSFKFLGINPIEGIVLPPGGELNRYGRITFPSAKPTRDVIEVAVPGGYPLEYPPTMAPEFLLSYQNGNAYFAPSAGPFSPGAMTDPISPSTLFIPAGASDLALTEVLKIQM